jgi:hypothetical protein
MTVYKPRSAWTSTQPGGAVLSGGRLEGVACHYPGDGNVTYRSLTEAQVAAKLRGYRDYHMNTKGWSDIGYSVCGDQSGRVWDLRGITRVPAAQASDSNPDANHEWGAFLWLVGDDEQPTPALIGAFRDWRRLRWLARWPHAAKVIGHGKVPGASTSCPGEPVLALIRSGALTVTSAVTKEEDDMALSDADMDKLAGKIADKLAEKVIEGASETIGKTLATLGNNLHTAVGELKGLRADLASRPNP